MDVRSTCVGDAASGLERDEALIDTLTAKLAALAAHKSFFAALAFAEQAKVRVCVWLCECVC